MRGKDLSHQGDSSAEIQGNSSGPAEQQKFAFDLEPAAAWLDRMRKQGKKGPGRPAKITLEVAERICESIALGLTEELACLDAGVHVEAWRKACQRNEEFVLLKGRARATFVRQSAVRIAAGGKGWQGRSWILERVYREQFGKGPEVAVNAGEGSSVTVVTPEVQGELARLARELFVPSQNG